MMTVEAEQAARMALDEVFRSLNATNISAFRQSLNYPHVQFSPAGQVTVWQTADEVTSDFDMLRQRENWHHSTINDVTIIASAPAKVHCEAAFSRFNTSGICYGALRVLCIVTNHNGHWGVQLRSGLPDGTLLAGQTESGQR